jgi:hypothetical protein
MRDDGETKNDIVCLLYEQLNAINDALCGHYGPTYLEVTNGTPEEFLSPVMAELTEKMSLPEAFTGVHVIQTWVLNIAILKVLKDDDMNGFVYCRPVETRT